MHWQSLLMFHCSKSQRGSYSLHKIIIASNYKNLMRQGQVISYLWLYLRYKKTKRSKSFKQQVKHLEKY